MIRRILLCTVPLLLLACGRKDESLAKRTGSTVGETITDFASGVGRGVDTKMKVSVDLSPELVNRGLSKTVARSFGIGSTDEGFSVYIISKQKFAGTLVARALDTGGEEIGRSKVAVSFGADDARYVTFRFPSEMNSALVKRYVVEPGS